MYLLIIYHDIEKSIINCIYAFSNIVDIKTFSKNTISYSNVKKKYNAYYDLKIL